MRYRTPLACTCAPVLCPARLRLGVRRGAAQVSTLDAAAAAELVAALRGEARQGVEPIQVISAFQVPRVKYDPIRHAFYLAPGPAPLLGTAEVPFAPALFAQPQGGPSLPRVTQRRATCAARLPATCLTTCLQRVPYGVWTSPAALTTRDCRGPADIQAGLSCASMSTLQPALRVPGLLDCAAYAHAPVSVHIGAQALCSGRRTDHIGTGT